ncbi:unnamed protein product [Sympodiomycopsis kandeliae]
MTVLKDKTLSSHLLSSTDATALSQAVEHPFLTQAGNGTLSKPVLSAWLTQDRLYGLIGYTKLLSGLYAKLPTSALLNNNTAGVETMWKRLQVIGGASSNIVREMKFFEDVARKNNIPLKNQQESLLGEVNEITRGYIDYISDIAANGTFEECLVLLWAMEVLYLKAWNWAKHIHFQTSTSKIAANEVNSALSELIPNWTSPEFTQFVNDITQLVDEIDVHSQQQLQDYQLVWNTTLWYEQRFWTGSPTE